MCNLGTTNGPPVQKGIFCKEFIVQAALRCPTSNKHYVVGLETSKSQTWTATLRALEYHLTGGAGASVGETCTTWWECIKEAVTICTVLRCLDAAGWYHQEQIMEGTHQVRTWVYKKTWVSLLAQFCCLLPRNEPFRLNFWCPVAFMFQRCGINVIKIFLVVAV